MFDFESKIAIGNTLEDAYELAEEIELLCEYYYFCKLQKNPRNISNSDMTKVLNKIKDYKTVGGAPRQN